MNEYKYRTYFASEDNGLDLEDRFSSDHVKCGIIENDSFGWNSHIYEVNEAYDGFVTTISLLSSFNTATFIIGFLFNDKYCSHIHLHAESKIVKGSTKYVACAGLLNRAYAHPMDASYEIIGDTIYVHMSPEDYMEVMLSI